MNNQSAPQDKDPHLWERAKRRVSFKYHLASYIIVNIFLWVIWYVTGKRDTYNEWPWPVWPMVGWGIGLLFHLRAAYFYPGSDAVDREYEKLKQKQNK